MSFEGQEIVSAENVIQMLERAKDESNKDLQRDCMRILHDRATILLLGNAKFADIGKRFNVPCIECRTGMIRIGNNIVCGIRSQRFTTRFRDLYSFNFPDFVDRVPAKSPTEISTPLDESIISLTKYVFSNRMKLALEEIDFFLVSDYGEFLFNRFQLLHIAHRFDLPSLRRRCYESIKTLEEIETMESNEAYNLQLSVRDQLLLENCKHLMTMGVFNHQWDYQRGMVFNESIATRYAFESGDSSTMDEEDCCMPEGSSDDERDEENEKESEEEDEGGWGQEIHF